MSPKKIKRLADKMFRAETGLFLVEGEKNIRELLTSDFLIEEILGTEAFIDAITDSVNAYEARMTPQQVFMRDARADMLADIGTLMTNEAGIAIVRQKSPSSHEAVLERAQDNLVLFLDDVRDPGNLGTIVRIADWYGVTHIAASLTTTDFYNPKVIAASMGSFTRVSVLYTPLIELLSEAHARSIPVIAADLEGINTHTGGLPRTGILLMGSESHGISDEVLTLTTHRVTIPRFGGAESLNVSVATGILLDTLRRGI
jgi:TrmH family RNA methyltransferase